MDDLSIVAGKSGTSEQKRATKKSKGHFFHILQQQSIPNRHLLHEGLRVLFTDREVEDQTKTGDGGDDLQSKQHCLAILSPSRGLTLPEPLLYLTDCTFLGDIELFMDSAVGACPQKSSTFKSQRGVNHQKQWRLNGQRTVAGLHNGLSCFFSPLTSL